MASARKFKNAVAQLEQFVDYAEDHICVPKLTHIKTLRDKRKQAKVVLKELHQLLREASNGNAKKP